MARTQTLILIVVLLWNGLCAGQQEYAGSAPNQRHPFPIYFAPVPPNFGYAYMDQALYIAQANLALLQPCSVGPCLPENPFPGWNGQPEPSQVEFVLGMPVPEQTIASFSIPQVLPPITGPSTDVTAPVSGLSLASASQMPAAATLTVNP